MEEKHFRKSYSILTVKVLIKIFVYSSLTIFSSYVTSISSLDRLNISFFYFELSFSMSHFLHYDQIFSFSFSFKPPWSAKVARKLSTLTSYFFWWNLTVSRLVSAEELFKLLNWNTAPIFIATILLKLIFSKLLGWRQLT